MRIAGGKWWFPAAAVSLAVVLAVTFFVTRPDNTPAPLNAVTSNRSTTDPRLTYAGPYRNVHPDVQYVGDATCANCHFQQVETFREHPMGRSMFRVEEEPAPAPIDAASRNPFSGLGTNFRVERRGPQTWHHEFRLDDRGQVIYDHAIQMKYVIGSGERGKSFLWERDGYVFQSAISWYRQKTIWDVSPGWVDLSGGRPIEGGCLYCHTNRVEPLPGYVNRFVEPVIRQSTIGCERCHGPGEKHVARWNGNEPAEPGQDLTIVNPGRLAWPLREAVCQQCHLEGETRLVKRGRRLNDFRPGLPLEKFWAIAVHDEEDYKVVNHVEQMYRSECFNRSSDDAKLGCISCHDPHVKPKSVERVEYFRLRCLKCHQDEASKQGPRKQCGVAPAARRHQNGNDCMGCHMPKRGASDVPHVAGTDHRILRRPTQDKAEEPHHAAVNSTELPVRLFHRGRFQDLGPEDRRDLAMALADTINLNKLPPIYSPRAIELLDAALNEVPDDVDAWEAKGIVLVKSNRLREAYSAFMQALQREPEREPSLLSAAYLAERLDRRKESIEFWKRAIAKNPHRMLYRANLAAALSKEHRWNEGREHADFWVQENPGSIEARHARALYRLRTGDFDGAKADFAIIEALKPPNLPELKAWWESENRIRGP